MVSNLQGWIEPKASRRQKCICEVLWTILSGHFRWDNPHWVTVVSCFHSVGRNESTTPKWLSTTSSQCPQRTPRWLPVTVMHSPHRRTRTTSRNQRPPSTARATWSSVPPPANCPCLVTLTPMVWLWRTLPDIFFPNLKRGNILRNWGSCRTNQVTKFQIFQDTKKPNHGKWESWLKAMEGASITLGKTHKSVTTEIAQTGHWWKWPLLMWLHWYLLP